MKKKEHFINYNNHMHPIITVGGCIKMQKKKLSHIEYRILKKLLLKSFFVMCFVIEVLFKMLSSPLNSQLYFLIIISIKLIILSFIF